MVRLGPDRPDPSRLRPRPARRSPRSARAPLARGELAFYRVWTPAPVPLRELVRVAGRRWAIEEAFQAGKGLAGLDEHQVGRWTSWRRWSVLAMLAHAFLAVTAAATASGSDHADTMHLERNASLTCAGIRHLLAAIVLATTRAADQILCWSRYRRARAARARTSHYARQAAIMT